MTSIFSFSPDFFKSFFLQIVKALACLVKSLPTPLILSMPSMSHRWLAEKNAPFPRLFLPYQRSRSRTIFECDVCRCYEL